MTQSYLDFPETDSLAVSRPLILANDRTIMSNAAGTAFPTGAANTELGMLCYRTDQKKLYALTDQTTVPYTWTLVADLSSSGLSLAAGDLRYALIGHNHRYDVNDLWLGITASDSNVQVDGNTHQMAFKTAGTTIYAPSLTAFPFIWQYGGDAPANSLMGLNTDGTLWTKAYGNLQDRFLSGQVNSTISAGIGLYANNGGSSGDAPNGKGKLQYTGSSWVINAGADSALVADFRRGATDIASIANDGRIWSNRYGFLDAAFTPQVSATRPGTYKIYRRDADEGHSVQAHFDASLGGYRLRGYDAGDTYTHEVLVHYADVAGTATSATFATSAGHASTADSATVASSISGGVGFATSAQYANGNIFYFGGDNSCYITRGTDLHGPTFDFYLNGSFIYRMSTYSPDTGPH